MTKKQINALLDIISGGQYLYDHLAKTPKDKPSPRHICGERMTPSGYYVTDGYVGVCYHDPVPELPHDSEYDDASDKLHKMIAHQWTDGDYYLVEAPFNGVVRQSEIRGLLRDNTQGTKLDINDKRIYLNTQTKQDRQMISCFNPLYVRRAVEAIGGTVRLYIGKTQRDPFPFLIVVPDTDACFDLEQVDHAIVMPIRMR